MDQTYPLTEAVETSSSTDSRRLVIITMAVAILLSWAYVLWAKNNYDQKMTNLVNQYESVTSLTTELQTDYDTMLFRLDSLEGYNNSLEGKLSFTNSEIAELKSQINSILRKDKITSAQLRNAEVLIGELKKKIRFLEQEIVRLKKENEALIAETEAINLEKNQYKAQKDTLEIETNALTDKLYYASTLNASTITITPVAKKSGTKVKVTSKAKKVDKILVAFEVDNRIIETGTTEIYLLIVGPDGKPLGSDSTSTFASLDEGEKPYTAIIPVEIETGKKKRVEFAWDKNSSFKKGDYHFTIYHNGIKIGESLKKLA